MSVGKGSFGFAVLLCLALSAQAQDSTSKRLGLPGDAVDAYNTAEQCNDYIVDLTEFFGSWGTRFGIAPVVKMTKSCDPIYYNHLWSAQAMSNNRLENVAFARDGYYLWTAPGYGINNDPTINDPGTLIDTSNMRGDQFAVAFNEYGAFGGQYADNVITGVVNMDLANPKRLYVSRIAAAQNASQCGCSVSGLGLGGIDSHGNVYFRADSFGTGGCAGLTKVTDNNYFSVDSLARTCSVLNVMSGDFPGGLFDAPATQWLLRASATNHNTPGCVPELIAGSQFLIGSNFNIQYVRGSSFPLTSDSTHLNPCFTDHRGNMAFSHFQFPGLLGSSDWGTAGLVGHQNGIATGLNLFGVGVNGVVTGTLCALLPAVVVDNCTGFKNTDLGPGQNEFDHYHSQVAYQGGNGQVAVGKDAAGRMLVAAMVSYPTYSQDNPLNYIAVMRMDPQTGIPEWTMAYYNNGTAAGTGDPADTTSKPIYDGPPSSPTTSIIGQTVPLFVLTGGTPLGPSVSAPMMDASGNVWFIATVELYKKDALGQPYSDFDNALLRAVYCPDCFTYCLELIAEVGDVFKGQNSNVDYQVRYLSLADSNSVDSGTAWSGNILQQPLHNLAPGQDLCPRDPDSLAGLVIAADLVYDTNGDDDFDQAVDESYNALLYVGSISTDPCAIELAVKPSTVTAGNYVEFNTFFGNSGDPTLLVVTGVNGIPVWTKVLPGSFGSNCMWTLGSPVPPGFGGLTVDFRTYAINPCGYVGVTNEATLTIY
ncbi:MAG: hypothetical protein AB1486_16380 [Planctomycetota bacterium]